jgi:hypothetical protein
MTYQLCILTRGENEREQMYVPYYFAQTGNVIDWCRYDPARSSPTTEDWSNGWLIEEADDKLFNMFSMRPTMYFRIHQTEDVLCV